MVKPIKIQVYIDLENIQPPHAEERARLRVSRLLSGIKKYLEADGYCIERVWACSKPRAPQGTRRVIDEVFADFGYVMYWTKQAIADYEIRQQLRVRWEAGILSPAILFISNDNDFSRDLLILRGAGIEVLVSGTSVGSQLRQSASRIIAFSEMAQ